MFAKRTNWNLQTNRLSEGLAAHRAAGKPLIDLTVSNPTECGFKYDEKAILDALRNPAAMQYEPNSRGLEVAREAVQRYYSERGEPAAGPEVDDIFLTTSTSEAYSFVFRTLCDPGDEVLIPEPSYPLFEFLADIQDVRLVRYALVYDHCWQIDGHSLEQGITPRTRAVMVVNPNNPTGNYCKREEMRRLNEICAARDVAIVADEVFLDFGLETEADREPGGGRHGPPSFSANESALTFTLSGISKICGLPQMKAAWVAMSGPEGVKSQAVARLEVIADTYLSLNAPVQWALPTLLKLRRGFQEQLLARVRENLDELDRQLERNRGVERLEVEAGWNVVIRVPATQADEELALRLLGERGVYVHPGHFYDFHKDGYLVVSLITRAEDFAHGIGAILASTI
jgi:alanine-synthesizing transaminase